MQCGSSPSDTTRVANLALDLLEITDDHERRRVIDDLVDDDRLAVLGCLDAAHNELTGREMSEEAVRASIRI